MKNLSKFAAIAGVTTAVAAFTLSPVMASSPGQLGGGPNIYKVKDVTANGSYASSINANACDVLEYSINLHNVNFGELTNIVVSAPLSTSGSSNMTAVPASGASAGTSGSVTVNAGSASGVTYEAGTTELYNGSGQPVKDLPDGITSGGINVGNLNGSTGEFVNFKAKVNCPTPVTPVTPSTPATTASVTPTALPQTGPDDLAGLAGIGGTGAIGYGVMAYRRSKKALAQKLLNRK
ncbi:MAG TPA: LPXTG cell wall anchor domain-containing protein [Candidatus Saccharimonadales bacterium]|nr:LPXTG cell wall anchor domain-containing protein [Candidatus Saccharimonadales bacterium]